MIRKKTVMKNWKKSFFPVLKPNLTKKSIFQKIENIFCFCKFQKKIFLKFWKFVSVPELGCWFNLKTQDSRTNSDCSPESSLSRTQYFLTATTISLPFIFPKWTTQPNLYISRKSFWTRVWRTAQSIGSRSSRICVERTSTSCRTSPTVRDSFDSWRSPCHAAKSRFPKSTPLDTVIRTKSDKRLSLIINNLGIFFYW